jgi:hypothetical protein
MYRYNNGIGPVLDNFQRPAFEYCHGGFTEGMCNGKAFTGQSVTGGYVYRGAKQADIYAGQYIFAGNDT